jgi:hypothetical protein
VKLTFSTPQGAVEGDFPADLPLHDLKAEVLSRLKLPSEWVDQYIVACDDKTLDEHQSPADLGLAENSTLVVWRVSSSHAARDRASGP